MNKKLKNVLLWLSRILLALGFLMASLGKLTGNPQVLEMFREWGYPNGFHLLIGVVELGGAVLLLVPKLSRYAAFLMLIVMLGALITHALHDPISNLLRPLIFMLFIGIILLLDRPATT